jgi:exodeoxyribonuclease VII large subunit
VARHRARLHQLARELRAVTRRALTEGDRATAARAASLARKSAAASTRVERTELPVAALDRAATTAVERRRRELDRALATLAAHDPQRTLERGYALLEDDAGEPVTSGASARVLHALTIRMHDGRFAARPERP